MPAFEKGAQRSPQPHRGPAPHGLDFHGSSGSVEQSNTFSSFIRGESFHGSSGSVEQSNTFSSFNRGESFHGSSGSVEQSNNNTSSARTARNVPRSLVDTAFSGSAPSTLDGTDDSHPGYAATAGDPSLDLLGQTQTDAWPCRQCTFLNVAASPTCVMCDTQRLDENASHRYPSDVDEWPCRKCTFLNPATARTCTMCNAIKQEGSTWRGGLSTVTSTTSQRALGFSGYGQYPSLSDTADRSKADPSADDSDEDAPLAPRRRLTRRRAGVASDTTPEESDESKPFAPRRLTTRRTGYISADPDDEAEAERDGETFQTEIDQASEHEHEHDHGHGHGHSHVHVHDHAEDDSADGEDDGQDDEDDDEECYDAEAALLEEVREVLGIDSDADNEDPDAQESDAQESDAESGYESATPPGGSKKRARKAGTAESRFETGIPPGGSKKRTRRGDTPLLRRLQQKKPTRKLSLWLDPTKFVHLDLGEDDPPAWWYEEGHADDQRVYQRAREQMTECFQKRKNQANGYGLMSYQERLCPFRKETLRMLQDHEAFPADKLADIFLGGMCKYRQWLMGLNRPPTAEEIRGIPRATRKQLAGFGVYTDVVTINGRHYMYTGSGTAKEGVGFRWRTGYEGPLRLVQTGKKPSPPFRESHVSVLLQPDAKASIRLRASWDPQTISPSLVVLMEAALIDFEDTMNEAIPEDVPVAGRPKSFESWERVHCRAFRDAAREAYPSGRARSKAIGLNRISPYKQGPNTGVMTHRLRVFAAQGDKCLCCGKERQISSRKHGMLSVEASFPMPGVPIICVSCWDRWRLVGDKSEDAARKFSDARKKSSKNLRRPKQDLCFACRRTYHGTLTACLPGHPNGGVCGSCWGDWKKNKDKQSEDEWLADRNKLEGVQRMKGSKAPPMEGAKPKDTSGVCFACKNQVDKLVQTDRLPSHQGVSICQPCTNSYRRISGEKDFIGEAAWLRERALKQRQPVDENDPRDPCFACNEKHDTLRTTTTLAGNPGVKLCTPCVSSWKNCKGVLSEASWLGYRRAGMKNMYGVMQKARAPAPAATAPAPAPAPAPAVPARCFACNKEADPLRVSKILPSNQGVKLCVACSGSWPQNLKKDTPLDEDVWLAARKGGRAAMAAAVKAAAEKAAAASA
jgi:hypothetical protein